MAIVHTWSINPELLTKDQGSNSNVVYSVLWRLASKETVGTFYTKHLLQIK